MGNLWGGRFDKKMEKIVEAFNASIEYDQRLYAYDIAGSIAHVTMLAEQGIVTEKEKQEIVSGLQKIRGALEAGEMDLPVSLEDIHMAIESSLIADLGETGKKLHTARSRNDQVQVDVKLYLKDEISNIQHALLHLEEKILKKAEEYAHQAMPGFTHIQHAQPVTTGFWLLAYFQMFKRDFERLQDTLERMDFCPLGACALAGTSLPIDRHRTAELLGFRGPTENAMDTVSDRDYIIEFLGDASISMMHISRIAEEFTWWNSSEFSYIDIDDSFCTGSSIMPQKKNPDMAELLRGKVGRVYGALMGMLTVMKGTPLAYNKDFQEDKEGLFDAVQTWKASLAILADMLDNTNFNKAQMEKQTGKGFLAATDIAEYFAKQGIPFREAHEIVGKMVKFCENNQKSFEDLTLQELEKLDSRLAAIGFPDMSISACIKAKASFGGTAPQEIKRQLSNGYSWVKKQK
jgi:argininosuccinate lyase